MAIPLEVWPNWGARFGQDQQTAVPDVALRRMNPALASSRQLWLRWVAANAIGEFVGLGVIAATGFLLFRQFADPQTWQQQLLVAVAFVALGSFEGLVIGLAQATVLRSALPAVRNWVKATVIGAVVAWTVGMVPSTVVSLLGTSGAEPPPAPPLWIVLVLAAGLGAVAGPILAVFQWRSLRRTLLTGAWVWLPANAAAWSLGMPVIFLGAQANEFTSDPGLIALIVGFALLAAGAVVGAVHGYFLLTLVKVARVGLSGRGDR